MKRFISLILLSALLIGTISCGAEKTGDNTDTSASDSSVKDAETTAANSRDAVESSIPKDLKFDGKTMTVLSRDKDTFMSEFLADEVKAETVNDAVYDRNMKVEDQLGIEIKVMGRNGDWGAHTTFNSTVVKEVMAGTTEYDVISYYAYAMPMIARQNVLYNLNELPNLDLSKPWWHQKYIENADVFGKLYAVAGDINLTSVSYCYSLFFNKRLTAEYLPDEDLYGKVLDGTFTQDYLISITKDIYQDLDGDQKKSAADFYGYDINSSFDSFAVGGNLTYTKKTDDGGYAWDYYNERSESIIERYYDAWNMNNGIYFVDKTDDTRFLNGLNVFDCNMLKYTESLRDFKDEYGILPMPKYDESQERYYSAINDNYSQMAVPSTAPDPELSGTFLELMGEYSYKMVTPKYYEIAMKGKYLRDDESCQMFDIIIDGAWYDFATINTSVLGDPVFITRQAEYHKGGKNFASMWAANENRLTSALNDLLESYKNG